MSILKLKITNFHKDQQKVLNYDGSLLLHKDVIMENKYKISMTGIESLVYN